MAEKNYYQIIVNKGDFKELIWEKHVQDNFKPKTKRFWESQETFDKRLAKWTFNHNEFVLKIVEYYERDFPEVYEFFELNSCGFTKGTDKVFFLWVSKYIPVDEY